MSPDRSPRGAGVLGWRIWALVLVVGLLSIAGAAAAVHADTDARLLRAYADQAGKDPRLVRAATAEARPLYAAHCAVCHGADMRGDHSRGAPDLTDQVWLFGSGRVSDIEQTIRYGIRSGDHRGHDLADMPAFGTARPYRRYTLPTLSNGQIADLAQYIRAMGGKSGDPAAVKRGQALYNGAAQCYDCHTSDGRGDNYIGAENLADDEWLYGDGSQKAIETTLGVGRAGVCPAWAGRLSPGAIRALAVYIHARAQPHASTSG